MGPVLGEQPDLHLWKSARVVEPSLPCPSVSNPSVPAKDTHVYIIDLEDGYERRHDRMPETAILVIFRGIYQVSFDGYTYSARFPQETRPSLYAIDPGCFRRSMT